MNLERCCYRGNSRFDAIVKQRCALKFLNFKVGASLVAVRRAGGTSTFQTLNAYFTIAQMIVVGSSYWNIGYGMNKQEVLKDAEGLQTMKNLGLNMSWLLNSLEAAKTVVQEPNTKTEISTSFIRD